MLSKFIKLCVNILLFYLAFEAGKSEAKDENIDLLLKRINFELKKEAKTVSIIGDFNNWDSETHKMFDYGDNQWKLTVNLPDGFYKYMFLIDNTTKISDPNSKEHIIDCNTNKKISFIHIK